VQPTNESPPTREGKTGGVVPAGVARRTQAKAAPAKKERSLLLEVAEVAVLAFGLYLIINFVVQTVHVLGSSMYPTLRDQDYLIATKIDYRLHPPTRGDIIIMRDPYDSGKDFIKRVIAVPGDRLLIRGGQVYLNDRPLEEPYVSSESWTENADYPLGSDPRGVVLRQDDFFVMGDNRNHSSDSRIFGFVHRDQIEARAWVRVLPLTRVGPVDGVKPTLGAAASSRVKAKPA
jgi:signal peptidase I